MQSSGTALMYMEAVDLKLDLEFKTFCITLRPSVPLNFRGNVVVAYRLL